MRNKISIFLPSLRGGGAQRVAVDVANGLLARGYQVDMVLVSSEGVYHGLLNPEISIIELGSKHVRHSIFPLIKYLNNAKPTVLMSIQRNASIVAIVSRFLSNWQGKLVTRETNSYAHVVGRNLSFQDALISYLVRYLYRFVDSVIIPSAGVAGDLSYLDNLVTIPNPVNVPDSNEQLIHKRPFILGVGTFDSQKKFDDLIRAFTLLRLDYGYENLDLFLLGDGPNKHQLQQIVDEMGVSKHIFMPGFVDDPFVYMRSAAVFVLTSAWEGLPNVLIQAMACGAPLVATDCPHGPREILGHGRFGELVSVGDTEAIAAAIQKQLKKGRTPYPPEALAPYDLDHVIDAYQSVLIDTLQ